MYRYFALILLLTATASPAFGSPAVVWLEGRVPDETATKKVSRTLDQAYEHVTHEDLAFPVTPIGEEDAQDYERLSDKMLESRTRWNEYEVEFSLAADLASAMRQIDVVRDAADRRLLVEANLVLGAAIAMATTPEEFRSGKRPEPYRVTISGVPLSTGWVQASALAPERSVGRADLVDGSRFHEYEAFMGTYGQLPEGSIDLSGAPAGSTVFVDGTAVEQGTAEVFAHPGTHYVHFERDRECVGRTTVEVLPQKVASVPTAVSMEDFGAARASLLAGELRVPEALTASLDALAAKRDVYLAAVDDGKVMLEPWAGASGAGEGPVVTVLATGELGGGLVRTSLFEGSGGEREDVLGASGSLGFEVGIYNFALLFGSDVAITPGRVILYGNADMTANEATSVLPMPYGGIGGYILRPNDRKATLLVAGTYGYQGPAHWGLGGRIAVGIPSGEVSWFRITVAGTTAAASRWDEALGTQIPLQSLHLRLGLGAGL